MTMTTQVGFSQTIPKPKSFFQEFGSLSNIVTRLDISMTSQLSLKVLGGLPAATLHEGWLLDGSAHYGEQPLHPNASDKAQTEGRLLRNENWLTLR